MDATARISSEVERRFGVPNPNRDEAVDPTAELADKAPLPEPFKAPEPIRRKFQARLNYDPIERDVFIEILDPETGEVLRRFPAEKARKTKPRVAAARSSIDWPDAMPPFIVPDMARR